jgi:hypothetical protein
LKKRLCDANNCPANAEEDNISLSTNIVNKEDQLCVSITIGPKGIKKKKRVIAIRNVDPNHG